MSDPNSPASTTSLLAELAELRRQRYERTHEPAPAPLTPPAPTTPPPAKTQLYKPNTPQSPGSSSSQPFDFGRTPPLSFGASSSSKQTPPPPNSSTQTPQRPLPKAQPPAGPSPQRLKYLAEQKKIRDAAKKERERVLRNIEEDKLRRRAQAGRK